ncbi:MAG TPA: transposase [Thermoanaerobaculia bacterium]|nr:transposase [Thermoanaerobaculia bacterium]
MNRLFVYEEGVIHKRSRLPHWHVPGGIYFVTFRLADSLPRAMENRINALVDECWDACLAGGIDSKEAAEKVRREAFRLTQPVLDRGYGQCYLRNGTVALDFQQIMLNDREKNCDLLAWSIMPNHVHSVFRLLRQIRIDQLMQTWKSVSSRRANRILGRRGAFWQSDYFDVLVRDSLQLRRTVEYVMQNPAKAGLKDWRWVGVHHDRLADLGV